MKIELKDIPLKDLVELAKQNMAELTTSQTTIEKNGGRASRDEITALHESATGFVEIANFMLGRASEMNKNRGALSRLESARVDYVLTGLPQPLAASKKLVAGLRQHYTYLGGANPG